MRSTSVWAGRITSYNVCYTKLLRHAGSEDLELILHEAGRMPAEVQDTQLAAALCGHGMSVGFNARNNFV